MNIYKVTSFENGFSRTVLVTAYDITQAVGCSQLNIAAITSATFVESAEIENLQVEL